MAGCRPNTFAMTNLLPDTALLSSTYFGPVQWYQKLHRHDTCLLECHDNFQKQTFRNRCVIATANGTQTLTVPIERYDGLKCKMKDIRISDHGQWRHLHWNALKSAYGESPFFEFLADDLYPFFERRWEFLFDFNLEITHKVCELIDIQLRILCTSQYADGERQKEDKSDESDGLLIPVFVAEESGHTVVDYREAIHPKRPMPDPDFEARRYYQVYEQRFGFFPNLSILDLLFNMGNESVLYL